MEKIRIGGVPEHFNLPWNLGIDEGLFAKQGIDLEWIDYPAGTGAMCADLRGGDLDLAVVLTEGLVADLVQGNPSKIIRWYVTSPLNWGIHVSSDSSFQVPEDLQGKRYAISRKGSGSQLMAYVDAAMRGWTLTEDQFVTVGNLNGAIEALNKGQAEIFLWEKLMTKPYVDKGILRRIGERPTPWPCFVLAGRNAFIDEKKDFIEKIISIADGFEQRMRVPDISSLLTVGYKFLEEDIATWLQQTSWASGNIVEAQILQNVIANLYELGLIDKKTTPQDLVSSFTILKQ